MFPNNSVNTVETFTNTYKFVNSESTQYEVSPNETVTIIDVFDAPIDVTRVLKVNENATLNYIKVGNSKESSSVKYTNELADNATLNVSFFEYESSQNTIQSTITGDSANLNINGLLDLKNDAKVLYDVVTTHKSKSFSDLTFRNLLNDKSNARLNMFSIVEESAAFSKAFQHSNTILLSDDSYITVAPHLEISIDELEASHGATSGDLDTDSIYYLKSRGISEADAKVMLLDAIKNEVYENLENEELSEYIKGLK